MAIQILVPEMGESVLEATVSAWHKKEGEAVSVGEILVELETDKVNLEVGAKGAGTLAKIHVSAGGDVKVGDVLGEIDEKAAQSQPEAVQAKATEKETQNDNGRDMERQPLPPITPVASRLAQEMKVDVAHITGTGPKGQITKTDVEKFVQEQEKAPETVRQAAVESETARQPEKPVSAAASIRPEERLRMSRRRRTIAQRLVEAQQTTAMLTTFNEIDMNGVLDLRRRRNDDFQKRYGLKLGIVSFFVKASISALKAFPRLNAEIQGDEIVLKQYYDMGIAVGAEEGLVVPVIRDANRLSLAEIERQIRELVQKTEQGKLAVEDLRGGTFTITNGGVFGSLLSTPILNPPQVGILGLHKIQERPMALEGEILVRPMMYVALSYDHRLVDGREAVQFLVHIKQLLEDPERLLLEG